MDWDYPNTIYDELRREHREGMAADRLEAEKRRFVWEIEGWDSGLNELQLYIAGSGLHRIPADEVVRLASALLAEHEFRFRDEVDEFDYRVEIERELLDAAESRLDRPLTCDTCGRVGNIDDGIEAGGPCQEPCDGVVRYLNERSGT